MHPVTQTFVAVAALAVIAVGVLYVGTHVDCVNFLGLKGCITH